MYRYVLFDLDGTLTDPKEGICKSVQYALAQAGIDEPDIERLAPFIGPPLMDSFQEYYHMDEAAARQAVADYRVRFSEVGWRENMPYDGIAALLRDLKRAGARLAVASSKPEVFVEKILRHFKLRRYFDVVVGSELDGGRSQKAEVVAEALRQLYAGGRVHARRGRGSEEEKRTATVMVGDRRFDIEGAQSERLDSIGVAYGYQLPGELAAAGADAIAGDVDELRELLLGGGSQKAYEKRQLRETTTAAWGSVLPAGSLPRAVYIVAPLLMYYLLSLCMAALAQLLIAGVGSEVDASRTAGDAYAWLVMGTTALTALALYLVYHRRDPLPLRPQGAWRGGGVTCMLLSWLCGACLALGLNLLSTLLAAHSSGIPWLHRLFESSMTQQGGALVSGMLLYGVVSPLMEELLFRWLLLGRIRRVFGSGCAVLLSALFFGLYHGHVVQGVYAFLMGCVLALLRVRTQSVLAPYLAHMAANVAVYGIGFLSVGAQTLLTGSVAMAAYFGIGILCLVCVARAGAGGCRRRIHH